MCAPASKTGLNVSITSFVITVPFVQTTLPSTSLTSSARTRPAIRSNKLNFFLNLKRKPQLFKSLKYKEDSQI